MTDGANRAFVLGLDGVPWSFVERWARDGTLPNFERLLEEGAAGPLRSTVPASTPLAWPSIASGVWPDKHGVYAFQRLNEDYTQRMYTSEDVRQRRIWDVVSPSVAVNVPMTYPADEIDGTLVASIMSPAIDERYTHPPSLAAEIQRAIPDYEVALRWGEYVDREDELVADITTLVEARRELLAMLIDEPWELFFFTIMEPDRLQHLVWDEDVLREHYALLDEILGDVLAHLDEEGGNLFVVSDHGFGPVSTAVGANRVLERAGYLHRQSASGSRGLLRRLGIDKDRVDAAFDRAGVDQHALLKRYVPRRVIDLAATTVPGDHSLYDLDHATTEAFVHGFGSVYVNDAERFAEGPVAPDEVDAVKAALTDLFGDLTDPGTGEPVLDVFDGDEIFPTDPRSPDLVLEPRPGYVVSSSLKDDVFETPSANASHRPDGIFLAWGPDVEAGVSVTDATVVDVAPTVLHGLGEPLPDNVDGSVLDEVFAPDSEPARRPVETAEYGRQGGERDGSDDDMDEVRDRLQGLGYLE